MTKPPNYGRLSKVPLLGNTKEWFKRDIQTIKKSTKSTLKNLHWIYFATFTIFSAIDYLFTSSFNLKSNLLISLALFPVVIVGYLMLHILKTKGYDITPP